MTKEEKEEFIRQKEPEFERHINDILDMIAEIDEILKLE